MRLAAALAACMLAACGGPDVVECDDGRICPGGYVCRSSGGCVRPDQVNACDGRADGDDCDVQGNVGRCADEVCLPRGCGDGTIDPPEDCEADDLAGADCLDLGFYESAGLACSSACTYDVSACIGRCGDEVINGPEVCDGADTPTCVDLGFVAGTATCTSACTVNTSGCTS